MTRVLGTAACLAVLAAACGSTGDSNASVEVSRARVGNIDVVLLSSDLTLDQDGPFVVEFRASADGTLVNVGDAKIAATMPMPGSAPMFGDVTLEPTGEPGRFRATGSFSMAGSWRLSVDWDGPAGTGSATLPTTVH